MKKIVFLLFSVLLFNFLFTQNNILLEIDDEKISVQEFLHIYTKNNTSPEAMTYEAMKEYMDLFINFKLKVHEAKQMGLDTSQKFINELRGYRTQLAQPYLTDKNVEKELIREAYDRMLYDVNVSHILIKTNPMDLPEDTLKAYKKIVSIYDKLKNGKDFEKIAREHSEDETVELNGGNLGYKTVFNMPYEFENHMYSTDVNEISKPFRTNFGYHIVKVNDKRPSKGKYKVAHIMKMTPQGSGQTLKEQAKEKIIEIKEKINAGKDFAELAREYSQDRRTAESGGILGWVTIGRMIPDLENEIFKLDTVGQISNPIKTNFGWHLIKILDIEPIKEFEEIKRDINNRITGTERAAKSKKSLLDKLKKEYDVKIFNENIEVFYSIVTDSIFQGSWEIEDDIQLNEKLLSFKDRIYTQKDFYEYISRFNRRQNPVPIISFVNNAFNNFIDKMLIMYEEEILEDKYEEFRFLMNEYHNGILLFELTDKKVWSKAIIDTVGLNNFYEANKNNYMWDYRFKTRIFNYKDDKTAKRLKRALNRDWDNERIIESLNRRDSSAVILRISGIFEENANKEVDQILEKYIIPKEKGFNKIVELENNKIAEITVIEPQVKSINEARGLITADYQNYLENKWIEKLRENYKIVLHKEVLKSIAK